MLGPASRPVHPYAVAGVAIILAVLVRQVLHPVLMERSPYPTFVVAVMVTAWYGGLRPALLTVAVGPILAAFLFVPPRQSLFLTDREDWLSLSLYVACSVVIAWLTDRLHIARQAAEETTAQLRHEVHEREEAQEALRLANESLEARVAERTRHLHEANLRLQELDRAKSEFMSLMTHELRTPLNPILGFAQLLHDGDCGPVNEEQRAHLRIILSSGRHLLTLLERVLDAARIHSGKMSLAPEPVDPGALVADVVARELQNTACAHVQLVLEGVEGLPRVTTDPAHLRRILAELVSNAFKFTREGHVRVCGALCDGGLRLTVEDTGVGVSTERQSDIFTPFFQVDSGDARRYQGTGLGLYLGFHLARILGGRLEMQSEPGKGSVFTLLLPPVAPAIP